MAAIFARTGVLLGDLDAFCVGCAIYIPEDENVMEHIQKSKHTAKLPIVDYIEKYRDDFIKKLSGVYFCEICNTVINTAARVSMHVTTELHMERKRRQLKRVGTSIVFQNKYLISNEAWNSFVEDTCLVCDVEYDDCLLHKYDINHLMKVVKSKVIVDGENIYRKVGGGYQCLTCNDVLSDNKITEHLNSTSHRDAFVIYNPNQEYDCGTGLTTTDEETPIQSEENTRRDEEYEGEDEQSTEKDDDDENLEDDGENKEGNTEDGENKEGNTEEDGENQEGSTESNEDGNKEGNEDENEEEDEEDKEKNEGNKERDDDNKDENNEEKNEKDDDENKENIEIDEENKEGEEASGGINIENVAGEVVIEETGQIDINMEAATSEPIASGSRTQDTILYTRLTQAKEGASKFTKEVETFAQQNDLYLNRNNAKVYCNPCDCLMKPDVALLYEHVIGRKHRDRVRPRVQPVSPPELKIKHRKRVEKVKMQGFVKSLYEFKQGNGDYVVVNEQFCLSAEDYMGYAAQGIGTICQFCNLELTRENVKVHKESHMKVMKSLFLITSLESEFVRQVTTELYHCGFCGKVKTTFDDMLEHLKTDNHHRHKTIYLKMLNRFMMSNPLNRIPVVDLMKLANIFQ